MSDATPQTSVEERLRNDLKEATRQRDQVRMDTIRMALAAFRNEEVSGSRHELTEQERQAILDKLIKQRHESAELFRTAKRDELAEKEEREAAMLAAYLPAKLTD
ncbi:MAG TPA: GatB/YqeY domain-containing protein, partial [Ktedonobacterales bacterium]|nr:GatB/YqeY domain-containing protein [Ktedonobacterales bacterium]